MREWQIVTVALRREQEQRDRLPDDVAAADDNGARSLEGDLVLVEQRHDPGRRPGDEPVETEPESACVDRVETVDVLGRIDCLDRALLVDLAGKR